MSAPDRITPDVWLVVSPSVLAELEQRWAGLADSALMNLRLHDDAVRLVEPVDLAELRGRIGRKVAEGWQRVRVVFDGYGGAEHAALRGLEPEVASHVRWHDYREDPLAVVDTLRAPEDDALAAWQASRPVALDLPIGGPGIDESWRQRYMAAFREWEADARAADPELFEQAFPEFPIHDDPVGTPLVVVLGRNPANDAVFAPAVHAVPAPRKRGSYRSARGGVGKVKRLKWSSEAGGISLDVEMQPPATGMPRVDVWIHSQQVAWENVTAVELDVGGRLRIHCDDSSPGWQLRGDGTGLRVSTDRVADLVAAMAGGVPGLTVEIMTGAE